MLNSKYLKKIAKAWLKHQGKLAKQSKGLVNVENALCYFEGSMVFDLSYLKVSAVKCICRWFCYLVANKKHINLSFKLFKKLLSSSELNITSEMELVIAVDSWIKNDYKQRKKFAKELIKQIRIPLLSKACLENLLAGYSSFSNCEESKRYINKAIYDKPINTYDRNSINHQARYCSQKKFEIVLSEEHNLYKLYDRNSFGANKRVENLLELDSSTYKSVFINGVIYLIGSDFIYSYSTLKKKFIEKKSLGRKRISLYASICNFMGKINIVGGFHAKGRRLTIYDPNLDTWEERAEMSVNKIEVGVSVFCGKLVVTGGSIRDQRQRQRMTNTVEVYDHFSNSWSPMPPLLREKCRHDSVSIGNKLYVISFINSCEVFDYFSNVFVLIQNRMPHLGWWLSKVNCLSIGKKIVVFKSRSIYKYAKFNVEKQKWSKVDVPTSKKKKSEQQLQFNCNCIKSPVY